MDVAGYLLASGFALLVVLLAWSNEITTKSKELKELEKEFLEKANLKSDKYKSIIDQAGSTKESLSNLIEFLYSEKRDEKDIEILDRIKSIKEGIRKIDEKHTWRFWLLLLTSGVLFVTGVGALFLSSTQMKAALIPNAFTFFLIFKNLIELQFMERKYLENIVGIMEKL